MCNIMRLFSISASCHLSCDSSSSSVPYQISSLMKTPITVLQNNQEVQAQKRKSAATSFQTADDNEGSRINAVLHFSLSEGREHKDRM